MPAQNPACYSSPTTQIKTQCPYKKEIGENSGGLQVSGLAGFFEQLTRLGNVLWKRVEIFPAQDCDGLVVWLLSNSRLLVKCLGDKLKENIHGESSAEEQEEPIKCSSNRSNGSQFRPIRRQTARGQAFIAATEQLDRAVAMGSAPWPATLPMFGVLLRSVSSFCMPN